MKLLPFGREKQLKLALDTKQIVKLNFYTIFGFKSKHFKKIPTNQNKFYVNRFLHEFEMIFLSVNAAILRIQTILHSKVVFAFVVGNY